MLKKSIDVDVLCVGHACYDLVFSVAKHPESDEKIFADNLVSSGGGPAANAAIAVSKLGLKAAFAGYLGQDLYGEMHHQEFVDHQVDTQLVFRGVSPTPLSTVLVKPDGKRALVNYKGSTKALAENTIDFTRVKAKAILLDGHEPHISLKLAKLARSLNIPTILDAGSLHEGTEKLMDQVDYLVASEKFACQFGGDVTTALSYFSKMSPASVITLGEKGLIWQFGEQKGELAAIKADICDTTGAGDAFHGAFAAAIANNLEWPDVLRYSSVAGTLCCTKMGARQGLPSKQEHSELLGFYQ